MKCSECGSKCIKVQIDSTAERVTFECPDCCNVFEKAAKPAPSTATFTFIDARNGDIVDRACLSSVREAMAYGRELVARDGERPIKVVDCVGDFKVVRGSL